MAWDTVKNYRYCQTSLWQKGEEKYPQIFFCLPHATIASHFTNPFESRRQGSHSFAVPGMKCTGQSKEDVIMTGQGEMPTTHSFKVHSQRHGKRACYQPPFCSRLPMTSRKKGCIFSEVCKAPRGCSFLSSLTSLVPLMELVAGYLLSPECRFLLVLALLR